MVPNRGLLSGTETGTESGRPGTETGTGEGLGLLDLVEHGLGMFKTKLLAADHHGRQPIGTVWGLESVEIGDITDPRPLAFCRCRARQRFQYRRPDPLDAGLPDPAGDLATLDGGAGIQGQTVEVDGLAAAGVLEVPHGAATGRTGGRAGDGFATLGPYRHPIDAGNDVPIAGDDHAIADPHVQPFDLVPVVQAGTLHRGALQLARFQDSHGGDLPGVADGEGHVLDPAGGFLGRELPGHGPFGVVFGASQFLLPRDGIDDHDIAVDAHIERFSLRRQVLELRDDVLICLEQFPRCGLETQFFEQAILDFLGVQTIAPDSVQGEAGDQVRVGAVQAADDPHRGVAGRFGAVLIIFVELFQERLEIRGGHHGLGTDDDGQRGRKHRGHTLEHDGLFGDDLADAIVAAGRDDPHQLAVRVILDDGPPIEFQAATEALAVPGERLRPLAELVGTMHLVQAQDVEGVLERFDLARDRQRGTLAVDAFLDRLDLVALAGGQKAVGVECQVILDQLQMVSQLLLPPVILGVADLVSVGVGAVINRISSVNSVEKFGYTLHWSPFVGV